MCVPGATTSGVRLLLPVDEKAGTMSSQVVSGAHRVRRPNREDLRVVGRAGERSGVEDIAFVAGGRDHEDPGLPGLLDREGERIDRVGLGRVRPVGQVDDPDVHAVVGLVLDDPVDRGDHLADVHAAVGDADLEADDPGIGGDAAEARGRRVRVRRRERRVLAGDDAGHERPVAVRVEVPEGRVLRLEREVRAVDDLARRGEALDRADARVDERDVDAGAGVAGVPVRRSRRCTGASCCTSSCMSGRRVLVGSAVARSAAMPIPGRRGPSPGGRPSGWRRAGESCR